MLVKFFCCIKKCTKCKKYRDTSGFYLSKKEFSQLEKWEIERLEYRKLVFDVICPTCEIERKKEDEKNN